MKCQYSPSEYRYCICVSMTSADSTDSFDLKVRSTTRPVFKLRTLVRVKAWPLPGLTNSLLTIEWGSPSSMILSPPLKSLVL